MIEIEVKGKKYNVRNLGSEVTLNELSNISYIIEGQEKDHTEKWLEALSILGSKELVEVIGVKAFTNAVNAIQITNISNEISPEIEVNGRIYSCEVTDGEIELSALDLSKLEKLALKGGAWGNKAFAVVYKDNELRNIEHYTNAHLDYKAKIFGENVTADVAAPVIFQLAKIIMEHVQTLIDAQGKSV